MTFRAAGPSGNSHPIARAPMMIRSSLASIGLKIAGAALWLLLNVTLANLMPVEEFGQVSFAITLVILFGTASCFGFAQILMRDGSLAMVVNRPRQFIAILSKGRWAVLAMSGLITTAALAASFGGQHVSALNDKFIFGCVFVATPFYGFLILHREGARAFGRVVGSLISFNILRPSLPLLGVLGAMLFFTPSAHLAMAAWTAGLIVIFLFDISRLYPAAWSIRAAASGTTRIGKAFVFWIGELSNLLLLQGPVILAGILLDLESAALLYACHRLASLALFGIDGIRIAIAPDIARAANATDQATSKRTLANVSAAWLVSGLIFSVPVFLLAPFLLSAFGDDFRQAVPALLIMTAARLVQALMGPTGPVMIYGNLEVSRAIFTSAACISQLIGAVMYGTVWGVNGIAAAMCLSVIGLEVASVLEVRRAKGLWIGAPAVFGNPASLASLAHIMSRFRKRG